MVEGRHQPNGRRRQRESVNKEHVCLSEDSSGTSTSLLRKARVFDEGGWAQLVETYGLRIYRWCRLGGLRKENAADVCQEVFASVARKIKDFRVDREGDSFRSWIRAITTNKIHDYWRKQTATTCGIGGASWHRRLGTLATDFSDDSTSVARALGTANE